MKTDPDVDRFVITEIRRAGEFFIFRTLLKRFKIFFPDIKKVVSYRDLSLFDEIFFDVYVDTLVLTFSELCVGVMEFLEYCKFQSTVGEDWYARLESGETISLQLR